jgi:hypothetical protein
LTEAQIHPLRPRHALQRICDAHGGLRYWQTLSTVEVELSAWGIAVPRQTHSAIAPRGGRPRHRRPPGRHQALIVKRQNATQTSHEELRSGPEVPVIRGGPG